MKAQILFDAFHALDIAAMASRDSRQITLDEHKVIFDAMINLKLALRYLNLEVEVEA